MNITLPFVTPGPALEPGPQASLADRLNQVGEDEFYAFCQRNPESKFERRADGPVSVAKSFAETLSGEDVLPGFALPLTSLR